MSDPVQVHGHCDPRFREVREVFAEGFRSRDEVGAAVAVCADGEAVVDLWAGHADQAKTRAWERDTLANVFSTTKGMTAICAHRLVEEGRLSLNAPVAEYWPEFAEAGKGKIPVRWLLSHRAGLPAVRDPLPAGSLYEWETMNKALAAEQPWWTPGEKHGYHAMTYGWLVGEVVRRITGRSLGTYFREQFGEPLGLDFHIGLDASEHARAAEMSPMATPGEGAEGFDLGKIITEDPEGMTAKAFMNPPDMIRGPNIPEWRSAEIPAANGHGTARGIARIYGALARGGEIGGVHVLGKDAIARGHSEQSDGEDEVLGIRTRIGLGFFLSQDREGGRLGPNPRAFGHPGAGGSVGFADPDAKLGFAYVMNRMGPHILLDPRATALIDAVYRA